MISFDLNFFPRPETRGQEPDNFDNLLETWLASILRNGNIVNTWQLIELPDRVQVRVVGIAPDALNRSNWDNFAKQDWAKLEPLLLAPSEFQRIGELPQKATWCGCENPLGRVLFTTYLDEGSPIGCFDCGQEVPLYRLPYLNPYAGRQEFRGWQAHYKALDALWMASGVGERFAYRQLARPKSDFMRETRELAKQLETTSGIATYWFLLHYHKKWGKHCPLCRRKWRWKHSPRELFFYKCDHCRLISSEASSKAKPLRQLHL